MDNMFEVKENADSNWILPADSQRLQAIETLLSERAMDTELPNLYAKVQSKNLAVIGSDVLSDEHLGLGLFGIYYPEKSPENLRKAVVFLVKILVDGLSEPVQIEDTGLDKLYSSMSFGEGFGSFAGQVYVKTCFDGYDHVMRESGIISGEFVNAHMNSTCRFSSVHSPK